MIPPWLLGIVARFTGVIPVVLVSAAVGVFCGWYAQSLFSDRRIALMQAEHSRAVLAFEQRIGEQERARTALAQAALVVSEGYREIEMRWQEDQDAARKRKDIEVTANARRLGDLARTAAGLRDEAAGLAAGRDAATDSVAECRRNASTLGRVLGDVEAAGREMAGHAETWAGRVRQLEAEWPK
jgi:hypothetical protein